MNSSQLSVISKAQLNSLVTVDILWITSSIIGLVASFLIIVIVATSKQLTRLIHYHSVLILAATDVALCLFYLSTGIYRLGLFLIDLDGVSSVLKCGIQAGIGTLTMKLPLCATLAMALIRLAGIVRPFWFANARFLEVYALNGLLMLVAGVGVTVAASFGLSDSPLLPNCIFGMTYKEWAMNVANNSSVIMNCLVIVVSLALVGCLISRKIQKAKLGHVPRVDGKNLSIEEKGIRCALAVAVFYAVCWLVPSLTSFVAIELLAPSLATAINPYVNVIFSFGSAGNFLLYLWLDSAFRARFVLILGKKTKVHPIVQASSSAR